jgi:hypothetical protein
MSYFLLDIPLYLEIWQPLALTMLQSRLIPVAFFSVDHSGAIRSADFI